MAPEFFQGNGYNGELTDVFALGVVLFGMLLGRPPFRRADVSDPYYRFLCSNQLEEFWVPWDSFAKKYQFEISLEFKRLFASMVSFYPTMRLSLNEVISSAWVNEDVPSPD